MTRALPPAVEGLGSFSLGQTIAVVVIAGCLAAMGVVLVYGAPRATEDRDRARAEFDESNGPADARRPWGSDRGSSAPLSLGALAVGLLVIGLAFAALSSLVGHAMNAPARHGTSTTGTECGDGRPPRANGVCH